MARGKRWLTGCGLLFAAISVVLLIVHSAAVPADFWTAFRDGDRVELLSLHPTSIRRSQPIVLSDGSSAYDSEFPAGRVVANGRNFHDYEVLASVALAQEDRNRVVHALWQAHMLNPCIQAHCFQPEHGLRGVWQGHHYDVLICFHCLQMVGYLDDSRVFYTTTTGDPMMLFNDLLHVNERSSKRP